MAVHGKNLIFWVTTNNLAHCAFLVCLCEQLMSGEAIRSQTQDPNPAELRLELVHLWGCLCSPHFVCALCISFGGSNRAFPLFALQIFRNYFFMHRHSASHMHKTHLWHFGTRLQLLNVSPSFYSHHLHPSIKPKGLVNIYICSFHLCRTPKNPRQIR